MYVCMYNLLEVDKIYEDSKLYLKDIQSLLKIVVFPFYYKL